MFSPGSSLFFAPPKRGFVRKTRSTWSLPAAFRLPRSRSSWAFPFDRSGANRAGYEQGRTLPRPAARRKRPGWKKEFLDSLSDAAQDIGEISEEEIQRTIRSYRAERRTPEITVAAEI